MAARIANRNARNGNRSPRRWTRKDSPLWGSATGLLRALIVLVAFVSAIVYLVIAFASLGSLDDEGFSAAARITVSIAPFLATGMMLLCAAVFISLRVTTLMSAIMLGLGLLMALLPTGDGVTWDEVAAFAGPPAITLGLALAVRRLNRTVWHDERADTMPRELTWAAWIGIGYGWFYASVAGSFLLYAVVALASLFMLRWWQRFAVWIAGITVFVSATALIVAVVQGPPERLFHRLPWAIAVLWMVPLARRGLRELRSGDLATSPALDDGVADRA